MKSAIFLVGCLAILSPLATSAVAQSRVEELARRLESEHLVARWVVLAEIERRGPHEPSMVPLMLERIEQESGILRELAIQVLGRIGPEAAEAVPPLTKLAEQGDASAICSLGRIGPRAAAAVPVLEQHLAGDSSHLRLRAATALWLIERRPAALEILEEAVRQRPSGCSAYFIKTLVAELGEDGKHLTLK